MKQDIKNMMEMLEGLEVLGVAGVSIAKDGLGLDDIPKVVALAKKADVLQAAIDGAGEIPAELRDLDQEEIMMIIGKVFAMSKALAVAKAV